MTKEIQETLEGLKESRSNWEDAKASWQFAINNDGANKNEFSFDKADRISKALSFAIGWGEALDKAEGELGEKKLMPKVSISTEDLFSGGGYNAMHDIARPILAKAILENKEKDKRIDDLLILSKKFGDYHKEELKKLSNSAQFRRVEEQQKRIEKLEETIKDKNHFADDLIETAGDFEKELQSAKKELADIYKTHKDIIDEKCAGDELHCTCVPALRKRIALIEQANRAANKVIEEEINLKTEALLRIEELEKELREVKKNV